MKRHLTCCWVGAAGAIFFFSADQRFIIKEVATSERHALMALLPSYVEHMRRYPESLLPRIVQVRDISFVLSLLSVLIYDDNMAIIHPGALPSPPPTLLFAACQATAVPRSDFWLFGRVAPLQSLIDARRRCRADLLDPHVPAHAQLHGDGEYLLDRRRSGEAIRGVRH
jgi:hypothetical protein